MYDLSDTIVAVSSAGGGLRSILRVTGPQTLSTCRKLFVGRMEHACPASNWAGEAGPATNRIVSGGVRIDDGLVIDAVLYLFFAPHSYTGEPLAEIHITAGRAIVETLMQSLLADGLRPAGPGEFTARAYLHGKLDLAQAEAVNEIITSSNQLQLDAAEKLLSGRLAKAIGQLRAALLDILSLIEAGLDFSGEEIEFISAAQTSDRLEEIRRRLEELLAGSIRYESLIDLPSIGIAGAPNAGKSSLLNTLLGTERSIVSDQRKTTRDVLSGLLRLQVADCGRRIDDADANSESAMRNRQSTIEGVLFDCAGLVASPDNILDELAQRAAVEALENGLAVIFCVDSAKPDWAEDVAVRASIHRKAVIYVATKADLSPALVLRERMKNLADLFGEDFLATSTNTGQGLQELQRRIAGAIHRASCAVRGVPMPYAIGDTQYGIALTTRHRQAVTEAIENTSRAIVETNRGNEEVAAMLIRSAYQALSDVEQHHVDEEVLDRIFGRFCIGK